jgi:hypothetical protein
MMLPGGSGPAIGDLRNSRWAGVRRAKSAKLIGGCRGADAQAEPRQFGGDSGAVFPASPSTSVLEAALVTT